MTFLVKFTKTPHYYYAQNENKGEKMKILKFVIISILLSLMLGCITTELLTRNYYVLEYFKHTEKNELKQTEP